ncbi:MAG TPA: hypothetical protein VK846_13190 [Candidatus Limnocylindria bacterium]|nr:hypothetical protein [Candidatus Limnocylindria bacterium]
MAAAGQGTESAEKAQARLALVRDALAPIETAVGAPSHEGGAEHGHGNKEKISPLKK